MALRPIAPRAETLPFKVPNSFRPLEPALPIGSTLGFTNIDPLGNPITPGITNEVYNFGWEYVWHCHILSHEENDMMRAVVFTETPEAPTDLVSTEPDGDRRRAELAGQFGERDQFHAPARDGPLPSRAGLTTFIVPVSQCELADRMHVELHGHVGGADGRLLLPRERVEHGRLQRAELPDDHHRVGLGDQRARPGDRRAGGLRAHEPGGGHHVGHATSG